MTFTLPHLYFYDICLTVVNEKKCPTIMWGVLRIGYSPLFGIKFTKNDNYKLGYLRYNLYIPIISNVSVTLLGKIMK